MAGLDQSQIAELLGFTRTSVSNWERGKASIPATAMIRWAEVTRISLDWIAWGTVRPEGFEPPAYCSVADPDDDDVEYWDPDFRPRGINWGLHSCRFCGRGFYSSSERDSHQWTCRPWNDAIVDVRDLVLAA